MAPPVEAFFRDVTDSSWWGEGSSYYNYVTLRLRSTTSLVSEVSIRVYFELGRRGRVEGKVQPFEVRSVNCVEFLGAVFPRVVPQSCVPGRCVCLCVLVQR